VKRIVEAHRGSVAVESDEVRTVFRVALPKRFEAPGGIQ
jgi:nitrogen-specific signal transduction histidine kinase